MLYMEKDWTSSEKKLAFLKILVKRGVHNRFFHLQQWTVYKPHSREYILLAYSSQFFY